MPKGINHYLCKVCRFLRARMSVAAAGTSRALQAPRLLRSSPAPSSNMPNSNLTLRHTALWGSGGWIPRVGRAKSLQSCQVFATIWTEEARLSCPWGFSGQEYWSGLPFPSPGESSQPRDRSSVSFVALVGRQVLDH